MDEKSLLFGFSEKSDEIKLEKLEKIVKDIKVDNETRKKAFLLMGEIFIKKKWWNNAAKAFLSAADLSKTFEEKKELFFKAGAYFVKVEDYFTAEDTFRKSIVLAAKKDKEKLKERIIQIYLELAKEYENKKLHVKAINVYNKILSINLPLEKANEIRDKMIDLYEKIGKPREANQIRNQKVSAIEQAKKTIIEEKEEEFSAEDLLK